MTVPIETLKQYSLVYLATPYSKYPQGIDLAHRDACVLVADLLKLGHNNVYSPIVYTHPVAKYGGIDPMNHNIWLPYDAVMIDKSEALVVAMMQTWEISYGIAEEIKIFRAANKPVFYWEPHDHHLRQSEELGGI